MKGGLSAPHRRSALKVYGSEDGGFLGLSPQVWRGIAISAGLGLGAAAFANRGRIQQSLRGGRARFRNWQNRRIMRNQRAQALNTRALNIGKPAIRTEPITAADIARMDAADALADNTFYDARESVTAPVNLQSEYISQ